MVLVVKPTDREAATGAIRVVLGELWPRALVDGIRTLSDSIDATLAQTRALSALVGALGAFALFLALVGLYGVCAYSVGRRMHEFSVRVAFGATRSDLYSLVVKSSAALVAVGLLIGLGAAIASQRVVASFRDGLSAGDPVVYVVVAVIVSLMTTVPTLASARAAAAVDPADALKRE